MILGKVKDLVRSGIGFDDLDPSMLGFFLEMGLRQIEKQGNFYWMEDSVDFNMTADDNSYVISASPISITGFKDVRALLVKRTSDTHYYETEYLEKEQADQLYGSTDDDLPHAYYIDNDDNLILYPIPDAAHNARLIHFTWTTLPANNLSEAHEILKRFPEALIYASVAFGVDWLIKNETLSNQWNQRFAREMLDIKRHDQRRRQLDEINLRVSRGPYTRRGYRRLIDNISDIQ